MFTAPLVIDRKFCDSLDDVIMIPGVDCIAPRHGRLGVRVRVIAY